MNIDKFRREFSQLVLRGKELQPLTNIQGTNSPLIQHTLNLAVSCIEDGEAYFEVGCLFGSSLAAASVGNDDKIKYCCDTEWQGQMPRLLNEIPNLTAHKGNFFETDLTNLLERPVSLYYYDANHDRDETYQSLVSIIPFLSNKALIFMDDGDGYSRVYNAWREFMRKHSDQFMVVHEFWTPDQFVACTKGFDIGDWHAGFFMAEFERFPEERDESIEDISIKVWHSLPPYEGRHNHIWCKELRHLHGKEEIHVSQYKG